MSNGGHLTRRQFVTTAAMAGASLMIQPSLAAPHQGPVADASQLAPHSLEKSVRKVEPFPMKQVRLLHGPFLQAMETNRKYLHFLPIDRLLYTFRIEAGLPTSAQPLGGWEGPKSEVRGHFSGHFLSACALMYASTGDESYRTKANAMVEVLAQCQRAHGDGYLSAFPESFFTRLREGKRVWSPFYMLHKIMAGHIDMYTHCGNEQALEVAEGMAGWIQRWTQPLNDAQMARILEVEYGGLNEGLYNLYALTGKTEYLELGHRFDQKAFFDPLAEHRDELKGLHVNTNIPKVIGAVRRYELTGERRDYEIASFFWNEVTGSRIFCTGGTSNYEHWRADPGTLAGQLSKTDEECCCGYNMLKLTRCLFSWTADPLCMDYYERTLFNSRLGTQNPENGMKMYYLPLASGYWKLFSTPLDSFWCCTGTGVEEFSKFGDTIYFHDHHNIYVNLFIASEVSWPEKGLRLRQETNFPAEEGATFIFAAREPTEITLNIRIPYWATQGGTIKLNGKALPAFASPSSYLALNRVWKNGDKVEISLPMSLHIAPLPGDETYQAVMYGPLVLAGRLGKKDLTHAMMYGAYDPNLRGEPIPAPPIVAASGSPDGPDWPDWIEPVSNGPLTFQTAGQRHPISLIPLNQLFGERYGVYWKINRET